MFLHDSTQNTTSKLTCEDFVTIMSGKNTTFGAKNASVDYPRGNGSTLAPPGLEFLGHSRQSHSGEGPT